MYPSLASKSVPSPRPGQLPPRRSQTHFRIDVPATSTAGVQVRVLDAYGHCIHTQRLRAGMREDVSLPLHTPPGSYWVWLDGPAGSAGTRIWVD